MADIANSPSVGGSTTWLTPPKIIKALGNFDLDPCAALEQPGWTKSTKEYTKLDNGLAQPWEGRVWLNPPYGRETPAWLKKLRDHRNGIALIFARTETRQFFDYIWDDADALLFLKGRLKFHTPDGLEGGPANAPSVLIAYGKNNAKALSESGLSGKYIPLKKPKENNQ